MFVVRTLSLRQGYIASKKNGSGIADVKHPSWPWYSMLSFLNDNLTAKATVSNMKKSLENDNQDKNEHFPVKSQRKVTNQRQADFLVKQTNLLEKAVGILDNPTPVPQVSEERSEDKIFGEMIAKSIEKLPDGVVKEELKINIQQLILKAKKTALIL